MRSFLADFQRIEVLGWAAAILGVLAKVAAFILHQPIGTPISLVGTFLLYFGVPLALGGAIRRMILNKFVDSK